MKKTCKGCFATKVKPSERGAHPHGCELGYQTDCNGHPAEACPKPKSWKQLKNIEKERLEK